MKRIIFAALAALAVSSCGDSNTPGAKSSASAGEYGPYDIFYQNIGSDELPRTELYEDAGGDAALLAVKMCMLDQMGSMIESCALYAQTDASQTVQGYIALATWDTGEVRTEVDNLTKSGDACKFSGGLEVQDENYDWAMLTDAHEDFRASAQFEGLPPSDRIRMAGPWPRVAEREFSREPSGSIGVWYFTKAGNKLRFNQERWNYCYDDGTEVDASYDLVLTMVKQSAATPPAAQDASAAEPDPDIISASGDYAELSNRQFEAEAECYEALEAGEDSAACSTAKRLEMQLEDAGYCKAERPEGFLDWVEC